MSSKSLARGSWVRDIARINKTITKIYDVKPIQSDASVEDRYRNYVRTYVYNEYGYDGNPPLRKVVYDLYYLFDELCLLKVLLDYAYQDNMTFDEFKHQEGITKRDKAEKNVRQFGGTSVYMDLMDPCSIHMYMDLITRTSHDLEWSLSETNDVAQRVAYKLRRKAKDLIKTAAELEKAYLDPTKQ